MNFFKIISPAYTPPHLEGKNALTILRDKIVQSFLLLLFIGDLTAYLVFFYSYIENRAFGTLIGFTVLTIITTILVSARRIPQFVRVGVLLLGVYGAALVGFLQRGFAGDGRIFMVAFSTLAVLMVGRRLGMITIILNLATYAIFAHFFMSEQLVPNSVGSPNIIDSSSWISGGVFFTFVNVLVTLSAGYLINNLQASLTQSAQLATELGKERLTLQTRVEQRTKDLQQRLNQIRVASEISRAISSILDPQKLMQNVVDLIHDRFNLYYAGVFIVDQRDFAVLKAGTGEAGRKMIAASHRLAVGGASMIGWCIANRTPRIALDVGEEAVRFNNPFLPNTRSEIAVPIISRGEAIGAISIQSVDSSAFGEADILILQGISDSLAVAMENSKLFQQTQENLEEIRNLNRQYLQQAWSQVIDEFGELSCLVENPNQSSSGKTHPIYVPIALRDQVLGTLTLETESEELSPEEKSFVEAVTAQTALALENARLVEETQRRGRQEQTVTDITSDFSRIFSVDELLKTAISSIGKLPAVSEVSVQLLSPESVSSIPKTFNQTGKIEDRA